ncbi:neuropeptide FF receptor 2-like [Acropora millepora]|uniref:neuropeptide FF receptor 2-like n=1 Tax=Acropora millepora TaxID=45264 RepID=UPI001CF5901C|nr:neuropeptide FF receptor 2-like [Acropora millepora]
MIEATNFSNASTNTCNLQDYLNQPLSIKIFRITVISIILLISLVGNTMIMTIVYKRKDLKNTVNFFIVNMAVSDLTFTVAHIPFALKSEVTSSFAWIAGGTIGLVLCRLEFFLQHVPLTVSVQSLIWIAVDRFMAVVFPMKINFISSRVRIIGAASTWIVAIAANSKDLFAVKLVYYTGVIWCIEGKDELLYKVWTWINIVGLVFFPLIIMTILYSAVGATLYRRRKVQISLGRVNQMDKRSQQAIKMSICIMVAFYLCNICPAAILILKVSDNWDDFNLIPVFCSLQNFIWFCLFLGMFLSTITNPLICLTFVESYRRGLKQIFACRKCTNRERGNTEMLERGDNEIALRSVRIIPEK